MERKKVIDEGVIWSVGDVSKIDVWHDKWVKNPPSFKVHPPHQIQPTPIKVSKLMTADGLGWDDTVLREVLTEAEVKLVGKIPLSKANKEDIMIRKHSIIRTFLVKSAYYVAGKILGKGEVDRGLRDRVWQFIWTTRVAPKIKYFVWKFVIPVIFFVRVKS